MYMLYQFKFQVDGNLVLYHGNSAKWNSGRATSNRLKLQTGTKWIFVEREGWVIFEEIFQRKNHSAAKQSGVILKSLHFAHAACPLQPVPGDVQPIPPAVKISEGRSKARSQSL